MSDTKAPPLFTTEESKQCHTWMNNAEAMVRNKSTMRKIATKITEEVETHADTMANELLRHVDAMDTLLGRQAAAATRRTALVEQRGKFAEKGITRPTRITRTKRMIALKKRDLGKLKADTKVMNSDIKRLEASIA